MKHELTAVFLIVAVTTVLTPSFGSKNPEKNSWTSNDVEIIGELYAGPASTRFPSYSSTHGKDEHGGWDFWNALTADITKGHRGILKSFGGDSVMLSFAGKKGHLREAREL